jgi:hypothetical protein
MKRLTLFAVLAATVLAWAAPSFAQMTAGNYWRTTMRYGGRDSALVSVPGGWDTYCLDIYSKTTSRQFNNPDSVAVADTTVTPGWGAIIQLRWTEASTLAEAFAGDSMAPILQSKGSSHFTTASDTMQFGARSLGSYPAATDTISTNPAIAEAGEVAVWFNKYKKHYIVPINVPTGMKAPRLVVRVRPHGFNATMFNYYYRIALRGSR